MIEKSIPREKLFQKLEKDFKKYKVIYLGAPAGYGKTCAAQGFLKRYAGKTAVIRVGQPGWMETCCKKLEAGVDLMMIDDVEKISIQENDHEMLSVFAQAAVHTRFLLTGRGELPIWLRPFDLTGQLKEYGEEELKLNTVEVSAIFEKREITLTPEMIEVILQKTQGWAVGALIFAKRAAATRQLDEQVEQEATRDIFLFFDEMIFSRWEEKMQTFALTMGGFDEFTEEMAQLVMGKADVMPLIDQMQRLGCWLISPRRGVYTFRPVFQGYLKWKQKIALSSEKLCLLYDHAGLYYALKREYPKALYYYYEAKNFARIYDLLLENSEYHAGNGYYYELEKYYLAVPEELASESPPMMSALSMLHSLCCRTEASEYWVSKLEALKENCGAGDLRGREAEQELAYLRIALPHRGITNMTQLLKDTARLIGQKKFSIHSMSVTGNMPSLMNGGKDFCEWSKHDTMLYQTLRLPVEMTLGKDCMGLADIALGESLFEKTTGQKFAPALAKLNGGLAEAQIGGNPQLRFAAAAIIARIFAAQGNFQEACHVEETVARAIEEKTLRPNLNAFSLRLKLLQGGQKEAAEWMKMEAPNEYETFRVVERYRYLTKVRCYLLQGKYSEALALLAQLDHYFSQYHRIYGQIEAGLLSAVVLYRMKDSAWEAVFTKALLRCAEYKFVRIAADEGAAIYELLQKIKEFPDEKMMKKWREAARQQAIYYPLYLKPETDRARIVLTETETVVLRLLAQGMKNEEIAEFLGITVRTVKFHITHIYHKLGVKNRASAIAMTQEEGLLL